MIHEGGLPEISENVESGEVAKVLVKVGDLIEVDQTICELETDKAVVEVPSPQAGIVTKVLFKEGDTVRVDGVLIRVESDVEDKAEPAVVHPAAVEPPPSPSGAPEPTPDAPFDS